MAKKKATKVPTNLRDILEKIHGTINEIAERAHDAEMNAHEAADETSKAIRLAENLAEDIQDLIDDLPDEDE